MPLRREVFQAKVLQRLYPQAGAVLDSPDPSPDPAPAPASAPASAPAPGRARVCGLPAKKIYTVLPPPEDHRPAGGEEGPDAVSGAGRAAGTAAGTAAGELSGSDSSDAADGDQVRRRRKRRRKRNAADAGAGRTGSPPRGNAAPGPTEEPEERHGQASAVPEGQEQLSKSRKRKLKKKRQKEKLRSLGMVSKSRPLEFTYRRAHEGEEEQEEENKEENRKKVEEVLDFLRTTWDIYLSDRSSPVNSRSLSLTTGECLFSGLGEERAPPAAVSSLRRLRALLGQRDVEQLNSSLQEFSRTSTLTTDETLLVCTLFNYWIAEVLPMQIEKT